MLRADVKDTPTADGRLRINQLLTMGGLSGSVCLIIWGLVAIMTMGGAAAQEPPPEPVPDHTEVQAELTAARARWAANGPAAYEISYFVSCFCLGRPTVTVTVSNGTITDVVSSDGETVLRPRTVESMFDEIQENIDLPAQVVSASFDSDNGRPLSFSFDISLMIADEEYGVSVTEFAPVQIDRLIVDVDLECAVVGGTINVAVENEGTFETTHVVEVAGRSEQVTLAPGMESVVSAPGLPDGTYDLQVEQLAPTQRFLYGFAEAVNCAALQQLQQELDAARATWENLGSKNQNYTWTYRVSCFCVPQTVTVEVLDGQIVVTDELPPGQRLRTVEAMFDEIQDAIDAQFDQVSASFDLRSGYPTAAFINPTINVSDQDISYSISEFTFNGSGGCCDPLPTVEVEVSCIAGNGRLDISLVSTTVVDGPVEHELRIGRIAPRFHTVFSGEQITEVATGRPDGIITVTLLIDGQVVTTADATVDCDPPRPEVDIENSCFAENGRFDIYLTAPADNAVSEAGLVRQDQPLPPPWAQYEVLVEAANHPALAARKLNLGPSGTGRIVVTGRPDDLYTIRTLRNGQQVDSRQLVVDCDVFSDPVTVTQSCLGGNGRLDVDLFNTARTEATFVVSVSPLAERRRLLGAGESTRVSYTGRPDGPISVSVTRNGVRIFDEQVTVACDVVCGEGYSLVNGECQTPRGCVAPQIELEEYPGVQPPDGEPPVTYSCVASCDPPAILAGPARCQIFYP